MFVMFTIVMIGYSSICFAVTDTSKGSCVFTGSIPDYGFKSWRVNFQISGTYTGTKAHYKLTKVETNAYIDPARTDVSNGTIVGSITQCADHSDSTTRWTVPGGMTAQTGIWPATACIYFNRYVNPNKAFNYQIKESGAFTFMYGEAVLYNRNFNLDLTIS